MSARIQREISLLVISLIAAVISLPMAASDALALVDRVLTPIVQGVKTPVRLALDGDGAAGFYVTDPRNGGVLKYTAAGSLVRTIKTSGCPQGVAVKSDGNLVVTMGGYAAIIDKVTGLEIKRLGTAGTPTTFGFADGVAVDAVGAIYVADAKNGRLVKFNAEGEYVQAYGTLDCEVSAGLGTLCSPTGVAYDAANNRVAVTDAMMGNVKFFSTGGTPLSMIGQNRPGDATPGNISSPMAITFEYTGSPSSLSRMYVVDSFQSSIQVFDAAAGYQAVIGSYTPTETPGLMVPTDAVYDKMNKRLLVANGRGNITIYGIDGGRNPLPGVVLPPPSLTVIDPYSIVNTSALALSGTVSSGAAVSCSLNGIKAFPATVNGTNWSCSVAGLAVGANQVGVTARNASPDATTKTYSVTYSAGGPNLFVNKVDEYVKDNPLLVSGKVDVGSTVQVCNPVATCYSASVDGSGNWSYSIPVTAGANTITVKAVNGGTTIRSATTVYDNALPVLALSAVPSGSTVAKQVVNISGTATDDYIAGVTVDGQPVTLINGRFSYPVVGKTSVVVAAVDRAGNTATQTINLNYNPAKVKVNYTSHADGAVVQSTPQTIVGSLVDGSLGSVTVNGESIATVGGTSWSKSVALTPGMNTILVDADGAKSKLTLFYDNAANPAIAVIDPGADTAVNTSSVQITAAVGDNVSLAYLAGGVETEQFSNIPFTVSLPQAGVYPVVMKATDLVGAVSRAVRNIIYDVTKPDLTLNEATGTLSSLSGTVEPGASVQVKAFDTGLPVAATAYIGDGSSWSVAFGSGLPAENLYAEAIDAAGNITSKASFKADGNINYPADLVVNDDDAKLCMNFVAGIATPTPLQLAHGDIGPLVAGKANPNGRIDVSDCILILRKASNIDTTW